MLILVWGISFHAVVVFGIGKNLLFKSVLGRCVPLGISEFMGKTFQAAQLTQERFLP